MSGGIHHVAGDAAVIEFAPIPEATMFVIKYAMHLTVAGHPVAPVNEHHEWRLLAARWQIQIQRVLFGAPALVGILQPEVLLDFGAGGLRRR